MENKKTIDRINKRIDELKTKHSKQVREAKISPSYVSVEAETSDMIRMLEEVAKWIEES
jgi:hypothetical protein